LHTLDHTDTKTYGAEGACSGKYGGLKKKNSENRSQNPLLHESFKNVVLSRCQWPE